VYIFEYDEEQGLIGAGEVEGSVTCYTFDSADQLCTVES
jgi:hypothetical protein